MKHKPKVEILKYQLLKDHIFLVEWKFNPPTEIPLKANEVCEYFSHTDVYCFDARNGVVPFYDRFFVEQRTDLFKPI